jgi:hypothetical protein
MTAEDLLSPGQHPGSKVPAKPGPAQSELLSASEAPKPWLAAMAGSALVLRDPLGEQF